MYLSTEKLNLSHELSKMHSERAGAIVLFSGEVRNQNKGKEVVYLEYEANIALADKMLAKIQKEAIEKFALIDCIVTHRLGKVELLDSAVVIITSSPHRKEAYESNRWIIDRIKHEVPIWKKEVYADGTFDWVLQCEHHS
ncbi:MAG: molybdenum cofactor biosynthesis protein MoaE [Leptospiraceae bacterium]|nr:molybdenum cofactor biosynthesis protein MoaE [Leptospiraceae bacterium]MCP5499824.1 molybdenum cofactor biosynthesis protein MoaE [Leptospiraceae bacterium]